MGGASLDEPIKEGEALKINGSVMMAEADTREEVEELIKGDVYYKEGVWDADKVSRGECGARGGELGWREDEKGGKLTCFADSNFPV